MQSETALLDISTRDYTDARQLEYITTQNMINLFVYFIYIFTKLSVFCNNFHKTLQKAEKVAERILDAT